MWQETAVSPALWGAAPPHVVWLPSSLPETSLYGVWRSQFVYTSINHVTVDSDRPGERTAGTGRVGHSVEWF